MTLGSGVIILYRMRPKVFEIIRRCVEEGVQGGWNMAHDEVEQPSEDQVIEQITQSVMDELHEYFEFEMPCE